MLQGTHTSLIGWSTYIGTPITLTKEEVREVDTVFGKWYEMPCQFCNAPYETECECLPF